MRFDFKDKTLLVTGGASGIGKIMVRTALEKGAKAVAIWDLNEAGMQEVKTTFASLGGEIFLYPINLADVEAIKDAAQRTLEELKGIDLLINNAGIVVGKYFHEHSTAEIENSIKINTLSLMHLCNAFLPGMMDRNEGAICNIASLAGLISNPKMSVYCASKWAVIGWSDSLRLELKQLEKKISVTTVMPYYISTGMFEGVKSPIIPIVHPEKAVKKIINGIEKGKAIVALPLPYWFIRLSQGLLPLGVFDWVMKSVFGVYDSMKAFKGRN